jgi:hypothetical protein
MQEQWPKLYLLSWHEGSDGSVARRQSEAQGSPAWRVTPDGEKLLLGGIHGGNCEAAFTVELNRQARLKNPERPARRRRGHQ